MELGTLFDKIMDYKFLAVGLAIVAILYYFKRFVFRLNPKFYNGNVFKTILTVLPLGLGVAAAIPKGILSGDTFTQRVIFGVIAAYFSEKVIYELLLKRLTSLGITVPSGVLPTPKEREDLDEGVEEEKELPVAEDTEEKEPSEDKEVEVEEEKPVEK